MTVSFLPDGSVLFGGATRTIMFDALNRQVAVQSTDPSAGEDATLQTFPFAAIDRVRVAPNDVGDYQVVVLMKQGSRLKLLESRTRSEALKACRALESLLKIVVEDVPTDIDDPFEAPTRRLIFEPREPETTDITNRRPAKKSAPSMTRGAGVRDLPSRPTSRRGRPPRRHHPSGPRSAPPFRSRRRALPDPRVPDRGRDRPAARAPGRGLIVFCGR